MTRQLSGLDLHDWKAESGTEGWGRESPAASVRSEFEGEPSAAPRMPLVTLLKIAAVTTCLSRS